MCGHIVQATSLEEIAREPGLPSALEHGSFESHRYGGAWGEDHGVGAPANAKRVRLEGLWL